MSLCTNEEEKESRKVRIHPIFQLWLDLQKNDFPSALTTLDKLSSAVRSGPTTKYGPPSICSPLTYALVEGARAKGDEALMERLRKTFFALDQVTDVREESLEERLLRRIRLGDARTRNREQHGE